MTLIIILIIVFSLANGYMLYKLGGSTKDLEHLFKSPLELRVPEAYKALAFILIFAGFSLIPIGIFKFGFDGNTLIITGAVFLFTVLIGSYTLLYQRNHGLRFDDDFIVKQDVWGRNQQIDWKEVQCIKLNRTVSMYVIETATRKIWINQHLTGIYTFLKIAVRKGITVSPAP